MYSIVLVYNILIISIYYYYYFGPQGTHSRFNKHNHQCVIRRRYICNTGRYIHTYIHTYSNEGIEKERNKNMDHNNTDMKIADMLTRYVEELEKKVDQIEYKIKLQQVVQDKKNHQEKQRQQMLHQEKYYLNDWLAKLAELKKKKANLILEAHLLSIKHDHELSNSILLTNQFKTLYNRQKKINSLKIKVHSNTFSSNNKLSQFIKKDEKSENKTLQRKLMNSVFLTKSIALQNDEANQKIIEKRSEIEVTQRKLRLINDEKKNNNVHKLQFEIDMLSKNVYSLEQSCVNIIKKIRTKRMA